jgi:integrase
MGISRVTFARRKPQLRYDAATKCYVGYRVDIRSRGKRIRTVFPTKAEAESFAAQIKSKKTYAAAGIAQTDNGHEPTVSQLFEARMQELDSHRTRIRCERIYGCFESLLDYDIGITAVGKAHFRAYIRTRELDGVKPETINREINELSSAFNRASLIFPQMQEDFEAPVVRPKVSRGKRSRREITHDEAAAIVATLSVRQRVRERPERVAARPVVARMFELAWMLGLRIGEIEKLLKSDYDRKRRKLTVVRWKTDTVSVLPELPDRVVTILDESIKDSSSDRIFDLKCSRHTVEDLVREACEVNGIRYGRNERHGVTFHSNRHSFTSRLVRVTDIATAASFTGHASKEMVDYYSHASEEERGKAMRRLYGNKPSLPLAEIYEKVRTGAMSAEEFIDIFKGR